MTRWMCGLCNAETTEQVAGEVCEERISHNGHTWWKLHGVEFNWERRAKAWKACAKRAKRIIRDMDTEMEGAMDDYLAARKRADALDAALRGYMRFSIEALSYAKAHGWDGQLPDELNYGKELPEVARRALAGEPR